MLARLRREQFGNPLIADLDGAGAVVTDQERHLMGFTGMVATDESVDRLQLVDETMFKQEIERAIHRGRRGASALLVVFIFVIELIKQVVGLDRLFRSRDQSQHTQPQWSQTESARFAGFGDFTDETGGIVTVLVLRSVQVGMLGHASCVNERDRLDHSTRQK